MNSTIERIRSLEKRTMRGICEDEISKQGSDFDRKLHLLALSQRNRKIDYEKFRSLYVSGETSRSIAAKMSMHPSTVTWLAKKLGIHVPGGTIKPKSTISEKQASAFYRNGRSTHEISKLMGCSQGYVYKVIRKAGIELSRPGRRSKRICSIDNCNQPSKKFRVKGCRWTLGSLCDFHRKMRLRENARARYRKKNKVPPERWRVGGDS